MTRGLETPGPIGVALAHQIGAERLGTKRMEMLGRIYAGLSPADKLACRAELDEMRRARRGETPARILNDHEERLT